MNPPYIHFLLCDNDYGQVLQQMGDLIAKAFGSGPILVSEDRVKAVAIDLLVALSNLRSAGFGFANDGESTRKYLERSLQVQFSNQLLDFDHDGGSVSVSRRHLPYAWRF